MGEVCGPLFGWSNVLMGVELREMVGLCSREME